MKTLLLVSLILSMMVYIGLKFFLAPSTSWGMAFKSRLQTVATVALLDAHLTADQEVAGSNRAKSSNILL